MEKLQSIKNNRELVLFDADGTLLHDRPDEISGRIFWEAFRRKQMNPSREKIHDLWELRSKYQDAVGEERQRYLKPLIKEFDNNMPGKTKNVMSRLAIRLVKHDINHYMYTEMIDEISYWRNKGATLGIISGSPDFYIQELKKQLGFDIATGTQHSRNGNTYNDRPAESRATEKHRIAEGMLANLRPGARLVAAYGDTMNDLSMLEMADEAVAVNPKNGLAQVALHNNWRIIHSPIMENASIHW